jgi:hypothetical protein
MPTSAVQAVVGIWPMAARVDTTSVDFHSAVTSAGGSEGILSVGPLRE